MKIIPRFYHGVLDYLTGFLLLVIPGILGFSAAGSAADWVPRIVGAMILVQAMSTDYELGALKVVPIGLHLMADYVIGAFLVVAPWVFGFGSSPTVAATHVLIGLFVIATTAMTQPAGRPRKIMA